MKNTLTIAVSIISLLAAGCSKSKTANTTASPDSAVLQGTLSGHEVGATGSGSPSVVFAGNTVEFHGANTQEWYQATFTLHEDTNPKQLEAFVTACPIAKYVGKTAHAIYKVDDGKLTLAANEPGNPTVPKRFDAPGTRQIVFQLKQ